MSGKIDRIGLVCIQLLPMTIVAATSSQTTVVLHVKHAETTSTRGLTDQVKHIAIGETNILKLVGIVEDCNRTKTGLHIIANCSSSSYAKQVKQAALRIKKTILFILLPTLHLNEQSFGRRVTPMFGGAWFRKPDLSVSGRGGSSERILHFF